MQSSHNSFVCCCFISYLCNNYIYIKTILNVHGKYKNFRSFKDQKFKFSKVNILIGENSSGKSSLLKFLLALKQTQQPPSRESNLLFKGEYTDLGSYKESIYYQDDKLPLEFDFEFDQNYFQYFLRLLSAPIKDTSLIKSRITEIRKYLNKNINTPTTVSYKLTKELNNHESISTAFENEQVGKIELKHNPRSKQDRLLIKSNCDITYSDFTEQKTYLFKSVDYDKEGFMSLLVSPSLRDVIANTLAQDDTVAVTEDRIEGIWYKIAFLVITQNYLNYFLNRIQYINPIDTHPARVFLYQDKKNNTSINDLNDVVEFFSNDNDNTRAIHKEYVSILKKFGIVDELDVIHDERLPVREMRVKIKDLISNIYDVGYGVALQLPIILKALLAERLSHLRNTIIIIEQPEVHLHPRLHSELISILLSLSKNTVYFIETHSEHIVRKLQVNVKNGDYGISPNDVTIHYLQRAESKSEVTEHKIESSGKLKPSFPEGFFDNSYRLAKELFD